MAFDTETRNRLNKFVSDARALLTDEFTNQFQQDYGMDPDTGEVADLERLSHLDDARRQTAVILRDTLAHYYANLPTKQKKQEADYQQLIERIIREQAFTILNRLCAIRMAEARDLVIESIASGTQSKGFQLYQPVIGNSLGDTGAAYQQYLLSIFDEFAVAAYTVRKGGTSSSSVSFIRALDSPNKEIALRKAIQCDDSANKGLRFTKRICAFESIPGEVLAYQLPNSIIDKISSGSSFSDNGGVAVVGLQPSDDFRFVRLVWEVPSNSIGKGSRWVHYAKGGEYRPYWDDIHLVVLWDDDGYEIKNFTFSNGKPRSYPRSQSRYYSAGITYPERTTSDLSPRVLPANCIFSGTGQGVFPGTDLLSTAYIAGAFSRPFKLIVDAVYGSGDASSPATMATHYRSAVLARIPSPVFESADQVGPLGAELIQIGIEEFRYDETSRYFCPSYQATKLSSFINELESARLNRLITVAKHQLQIEKFVFDDLGFTAVDVLSIDLLVGPHPESYTSTDTPDVEQISALMAMPMPDLIKVATSKYPPRRQLTMKSFIADRRIELIAHIMQIPFSLICKIAIEHHLREPGMEKNICESFVSYIVGVAFKRWTKELGDPPSVDPFSALFALYE